MKIRPGHVAAAAALVGILGLGGMEVAAAQEDDSTTTTQDPAVEEVTPDSTDAPSTRDGEPCDHEGRPDARGSSSAQSELEGSSL